MTALLRQLGGGDRRSIRGVPAVVSKVMADPTLFSVVFDGMADADPRHPVTSGALRRSAK